MAATNWWRGAVLYQIYPRSFMDSNGDGLGDLKGITSKLDHVKSLGVDGIWLSPFFKSPMRDFGYDVSDYCAVDPMFGSMQDFEALLKAAHKPALKLQLKPVLSAPRAPALLLAAATRGVAPCLWWSWAIDR